MSDPSPTHAPYLPMTREEMRELGWEELDILLITGDAYIDHPAFGMAIIGRALEAAGFRVGVVAQPDWMRVESLKIMGRPRLFTGVTAGAMDSMVANYTASRKLRRNDAYTPGGESGKRPNNATIVYANLAREAFPGTPVILGGVEASLRRFAYYDYWKNRPKRSVLLDSKADLICAGMAETTIVEIARRLKSGRHLHGIAGTVESLAATPEPKALLEEAVEIPSFEKIVDDPIAFLRAAVELEKAIVCGEPMRAFPDETDTSLRKPIVQRHGNRIVVEWPQRPMSGAELDAAYALPFQRRAHPSYTETIPALEPVQFSVISHRGCFGGCTFCALALHQGRRIVSRSPQAVLEEINTITTHPDFHGTISDLGGPTANMYGMGGRDAQQCQACRRPSCLYPEICPNLDTSPRHHLRLLRQALEIPGVAHLFIASGVRHDLLLAEPPPPPPAAAAAASKSRKKPPGKYSTIRKKTPAQRDAAERLDYLQLLVERLVGGHLSVAPEHVTRGVLRRMRKPSIESFNAFSKRFEELSAAANKKQYITPYFISSFPGSTEEDMKALMRFLKLGGRKLQQVQDFLPAPMTLAAAMYHAERDPRTMRKIHVAKSDAEREQQRKLLFYHIEEMKEKKALEKKIMTRQKGKQKDRATDKYKTSGRTSEKGKPAASGPEPKPKGRSKPSSPGQRKTTALGRPKPKPQGRPKPKPQGRPKPKPQGRPKRGGKR